MDGTILPPAKGTYTFYADGDNQVKLFVKNKLVLNKKTSGRKEISKTIKLTGGQPVQVKIEYIHATGDPSLRIAWSGPGLDRQILMPIKGSASGN